MIKRNKMAIQEFLGVPPTWPIKENVKHKIVVMPNKADVNNADKKDLCGCALAKAVCRIYNVPAAAIGGRIAYIPQRDENGKPYIARVRASRVTQAAIRQFDKSGTMPKAGFVFLPLSPCDLVKRKRDYMRRWEAGEVGGQGQNSGRGVKRFRCLPTSISAA